MSEVNMNVYWIRCQNNAWYSLNTLNLNHKYFDNLRGVYIIWYWDSIDNPRTVKVGQGYVRQRLTEHRLDPQIQSYADRGLYVTWTHLPPHLLDGVEKHIGETLQPLVGSLFPAVEPIPVSPPW